MLCLSNVLFFVGMWLLHQEEEETWMRGWTVTKTSSSQRREKRKPYQLSLLMCTNLIYLNLLNLIKTDVISWDGNKRNF